MGPSGDSITVLCFVGRQFVFTWGSLDSKETMQCVKLSSPAAGAGHPYPCRQTPLSHSTWLYLVCCEPLHQGTWGSQGSSRI